MRKQTTCYSCDKPIEPEWLPEGEFIVCDECSSGTDKISVEKLQEQLNTAKKALTEIYLDENQTIIDPVFLFHQSQRIAERALKELGENNEI